MQIKLKINKKSFTINKGPKASLYDLQTIGQNEQNGYLKILI